MSVAFQPSWQTPEGGAAAGRVAALGIEANTVTPRAPRRPSASALRDLRRLRFARRQQSADWLLDAAADLVSDPSEVPLVAARPAKCGWACAATVGVHKGENQARYSGVQSCASIWACPCCSSIIRARRSEEIQHAADWWEEAGHAFLFATFTVRHYAEDTLKTSLTALTEGFRRLIRGNPWKRFAERTGIAHMIKSVEVTVSWRNGWHAHLHVLWMTERRLSRAAMAEAKAWLSDRWAEMVVKSGGRRPSKRRGVDVRTVQNGAVVAQYISKLQESEAKPGKWRIGQEMARIDSKKGRLDSLVPFDLLDVDGLDAGEIARQRDAWLEYVETTKGRRATTWSRGLKEACGLDETTDEDLVEAEEAEIVEEQAACLIHARDWRRIQRLPDVIARILDLVELGRVEDVAEHVPIMIPTPRSRQP